MIQETLTPEQVARQYASTMDSVNLVNGVKPQGMSDADWADNVERNKAHIRIMLEKDYWTAEQDLAPLRAAL